MMFPFNTYLNMIATKGATPVYCDVVYGEIMKSPCPICHEQIGNVVRREGYAGEMISLIPLIKHLRVDASLGLVEAKQLADTFMLQIALQLSINNSVFYLRDEIRKNLDAQIDALVKRRDSLR